MNRILTLLVVAVVGLSSTFVSYGMQQPPDIMADSAVLIDGATGQVLFDKQMDKQKFPASTTKVMTALLALENLELDQKVIIDAETPFTTGSRIFLLEDEEVTVEQLLNAMMTVSANDAAVALARQISGSVPEFANLMNQRAKELGAKNTSFCNPNGLPDVTHLTTAYDLAVIAREAMTHEAFRKAVTTYKYTLPATNKQPERYLYNGNRLLWDTGTKVQLNGVMIPLKYEPATGIKTGYTVAAGSCFIASAKKGDMEIIAVVLQSDPNNMFLDAIKLLEYGFSNYKSVEVLQQSTELGTVSIKGGVTESVKGLLKESVYATLPLDISPDLIRTEVKMPETLLAPINKGQKIGSVKVFEADKQLGEYEIIAGSAVSESIWMRLPEMGKYALNYINYIAAAAGAILLLSIGGWIAIKRQQIKRRKLLRVKQYQRKA
jgi:D-alanyl-D-alanine carboxypeptidase (penicillin-binding protein 5/6)